MQKDKGNECGERESMFYKLSMSHLGLEVRFGEQHVGREISANKDPGVGWGAEEGTTEKTPLIHIHAITFIPSVCSG